MSNAESRVRLRGMTWDHPRGYDPLVACSARWRALTGVEIQWDRRSLQDFESYPVEQLARRYDLIVIDHPHIGQVTAEGCLLGLDSESRDLELGALAQRSVGPSFATYAWQGRQWALPIDAAAQVQAWRPDMIQSRASGWEHVIEMAREGLVQCPMLPPHSLMCLYTLTANLGKPCRTENGILIAEDAGAEAYDLIAELADHIRRDCFQMDPIAMLEAMATPGATIACVPLIYGYANYAVEGFRAVRIHFADMPAAGSNGPIGSALGGTGIAVSAYSVHREKALEFAYWIASGPVQRNLYARFGGQPGHADAWDANEVDAAAGGFYQETRRTLEGSWVRPRHNGYMPFQHWASNRLNQGLMQRERAASVIVDLNRAHAASFLIQA
jgi:multiple sugar transport system substrate-binding protein